MEESKVESISKPVPSRAVNVPPGAPVCYVLPQGKSQGEARPALVTRVHGDRVNLKVFTDGDGNKTGDCLPAMLWVQDVAYSERGEPGTWHLIQG